MSTPTPDGLQKQFAEILKRIDSLKGKLENIRNRTNVMLDGHSAVLVRVIGHTNCLSPQGAEFYIIFDADVGR